MSEFKVEHSKMYLFGVTRKVKEQLYMGYWVPEIYVYTDSSLNRI